MHLSELLRARTRHLGGVIVTLTLRCPLSCAHCTTNSTNRSPHHDGRLFTDFFDRMTAESRPDVVFLTGGEPLIRPHIVTHAARRMRDLGGQTVCLTGGYFARQREIPDKVQTALLTCDLVMMSMDEFHAEEVTRSQLFAALRWVRDQGQDVALQLTARNADDPFILDLVEHVKAEFDESVPMFTSLLGPTGRGADLMPVPSKRDEPLTATPPPLPCRWANWPVVASDGTVLACCNAELTENPSSRSDGLVLGDVAVDDWAEIARRARGSAFLGCTTSLGPLLIAERLGAEPTTDYCGTCRRMAARLDIESESADLAATPIGRAARILTEGGPSEADFVPSGYAELTALGSPR